MPTCFVIQPFNSKFDKRYRDVYKPALEKAGLDPYRVDQDPSTEGVMDSIEQQIHDATICLADITTDNPNVWYELGYAFAARRSVVMVCSSERKANSPSIFSIRPSSSTSRNRRATSSNSARRSRRGRRHSSRRMLYERSSKRNRWPQQAALSQAEISVLAIAAAETAIPGKPVSAWSPSSGRRTRGSDRYRYWSRAPRSSAKAVRRFRQVPG